VALPVRWLTLSLDGGYSEYLTPIGRYADLFTQLYTGALNTNVVLSRDRTQQTSFDAGLNWRRLDRFINDGALIVASIAAHEQSDVSQFQRMFREISDSERVAALRQAQQFLDKQNFRWRDFYMATTEPGRTYELTMVGTGGQNFMALSQGRELLVGRSRDLPEPAPASGARFR
jgi:hypothetical protein